MCPIGSVTSCVKHRRSSRKSGVRRRAMDKKLRNVEVLPESEVAVVLELDEVEDIEANEEGREATE